MVIIKKMVILIHIMTVMVLLVIERTSVLKAIILLLPGK